MIRFSTWKKAIVLLMILIGVIFFSGCSFSNDDNTKKVITLTQEEIRINENEEIDLKDYVEDIDGDVIYEVNSSSIISLNGSNCKGLKAGTEVIKVYYQGFEDDYQELVVIVTKVIPYEIKILNEKDQDYLINDEIKIEYELVNLNGEVSFSSTNTDVAIVLENKVIAIGEGTCDIELSLGTYKATVKVNVTAKTYKVVFIIDEEIVKEEVVKENESATAPTEVKKEGYSFVGWDKDYTNVKNNIECIALFKKVYNITYDLDGGICSNLVSSYLEGSEVNLPVPEKNTFSFHGYICNNDENNIIYKITADMKSDLNLKAKWVSISISDITKIDETLVSLMAIYNDLEVSSNLDLPKLTNDGVSINWKSDNEEVISSSGEYKRPYKDCIVTFNVTLKSNNEETQSKIKMKAIGFKDLTKGIASSYIYRNFSKVNDNYFEALDIINCAFITGNSDGSLSGQTFLNNCKNYIIPKAHENGCYVVVSIAPESAWSTFASTPELIDKLSTNIVNLINNYGFDGVDIDWEYPKSGQYTWFTNLVKKVREKVKANNPNHLVTAAIAGGKWQPAYYDLLNSCQYLDYINMMTYGMVSNTGYYQNALYPSRNKNNSTYNCGWTLGSCSISESVEIYQNTYKIPKNKIIVGLAFYGIRQSYSNGSWSSGKSILYDSLVSTCLNSSLYSYYYDEVCQVPYLVKKDGTEFISYDDSRSIIAKCKYVLDNGLAGVMHWESGCDTSSTLLNAEKTGLNK